MNTTFLNVAVNHQRCISEYTCQLMSDIARNKTQNGDRDFKTKDIPIVGYTDNVRTDINDVKDSVEDLNNKRIEPYKIAAMDVNPVGMSLPKIEYEDDEDIAKYYKDLRTVILDKFQEAANLITGEEVGQGGQGWINFIDTLATPEERASNYKIPKFDNVYTMFIKEKHPMVKIDKKLVGCALESLTNFNYNMMALLSEADDFSYEWSKKVHLHNNKPSPQTFEEAVESLAEYVFLVEEDFIMAQSLEARKHTLLEGVKNAHEILTALCAHNPRDIKESALQRDIYLDKIRFLFEEAVSNPTKSNKEESKSLKESEIDAVIDNFKEQATDITHHTLEHYKEAALGSNCCGVYMNNWRTLNTHNIDESAKIFLEVFDNDHIKSESDERIESIYDDLKVANRIIESKDASTLKNIHSSAIKKAVEILPFFESDSKITLSWACTTETKHRVNCDDVLEAVNILEKTDQIADIIKRKSLEYANAIQSYNEASTNSLSGMNRRDKMIVNIDKLTKRIVANLMQESYNAVIEKTIVIIPQSANVLVNTSRIVAESVIAEEHVRNRSFRNLVINLDNDIAQIVNK